MVTSTANTQPSTIDHALTFSDSLRKKASTLADASDRACDTLAGVVGILEFIDSIIVTDLSDERSVTLYRAIHGCKMLAFSGLTDDAYEASRFLRNMSNGHLSACGFTAASS